MAGRSAARAAVNMLADPGFETSTGAADASAGDQYGANGWTVFGGGAYTTASISLTGTQSFKTFGQYNGAFQQFAVTPGQSYTASVYAINSSNDPQGVGTNDELELNFYSDTAGDNPTYNFDEVVVAGTSPMDVWQMGTVTATVPAGATVMRMQINPNYTYSGGAAFWDDASLSLNTAAVPEPATAGLAVAAAVAALGRRRRWAPSAAG